MLDDAASALPTMPVRGGEGILTAGAQVGRFSILRLLGAGGMGAVYEARDPQLDRSVALKLLPGRGSDALRLRLVREAQALAQLQHPTSSPSTRSASPTAASSSRWSSSTASRSIGT